MTPCLSCFYVLLVANSMSYYCYMNDTKEYNSYQQVFRDMHDLTSINEPFKLVFRKATDGSVKIIPKALLRRQTPKAQDKNTDYKFNYIDVVNDECGSGYIPLLMSVNDKKIQLK